MNVNVTERDTHTPVDLTIVDCDIHPGMAPGELTPFLPKRWQEHMAVYGSFFRNGVKNAPTTHFRMAPDTARADSWPPSGRPPGADLDFMRAQHLDAYGIEYGILIPLRVGPGAQRNLEFGAALASALNDWQLATWIEKEKRFRGSIVVTPDDTEAAVKEIERLAPDRRYVQLHIPPKTDEPLGRKRYWPIFQAAVDHDLPLSCHVGGLSGHPVTGAGWPSFYLEDQHSNVQSMQAMLAGLVLEGAFERFPKLRVVLVEAGFAWVPAFCWRMDKHWERMRDEVPHLKRKPSEYVREHVWFTTQPIDEPNDNAHLAEITEWVGYDRIMFSTDYPHWDFDDPRFAFKGSLSAENREKIFRMNAKVFYGLD